MYPAHQFELLLASCNDRLFSLFFFFFNQSVTHRDVETVTKLHKLQNIAKLSHRSANSMSSENVVKARVNKKTPHITLQ